MELEQKIKDIWTQVTGASSVKPEDNFFEIGGNSMHSVQVIAMIKDDLKIEIPVNSVFLKPVFSQFVQYVTELQKK